MKGALVIFIAMVVIGIILYLTDVFYYRKRHPRREEEADANINFADSEKTDSRLLDESGGICCGAHTVCEKTNLSPLTGDVVYFDDEELDRFIGRKADEYTPEEIEEFRDVLLTLLPEDVAGWSRSIQVRGITLPSEIREELLMIVSDLR
ncbi:MAG: phospholipase [Muribaculaceae bacterium]|jgi:hypothetical protein